ncbi:hypothetical protein FHR32_007968 [Streptosporangium album]|uniref:Uncharacterized protein n=1 Tax=Streptosporangium album TaxID=47479 RepID=A0A7W7WDR0_9ACTN|nr:hypothetical protein [Streptosporangium album]MBB4943568.1 hypothetical protein [Streptosporangium album]
MPYARNQRLKLRNISTGSNLADLGRDAVHAAGSSAATSKPVKCDGEEATPKVCGVGVAMLPGYSWAACSSTGWW